MPLTEAEELELLELEELEAKSGQAKPPAAVSRETKPGYGQRVQSAIEEQAGRTTEDIAAGRNPILPTVRGATGSMAAYVSEAPGIKQLTELAGKGIQKLVKVIPGAQGTVEKGAAGYQKLPSSIRDIVEIAGNVGTVVPAAGVGAKALRGAAKVVPKAAAVYDAATGKVLSTATGVNEQALRAASTKQGRQALKSASGREYEIGQGLVDKIDNAYETIRNSPSVSEMLENVPYANAVPMINRLRTLAGSPKTAELKAAADKINAKADELAQIAAEEGQSGFVSAKTLYEFRKEIDQIIDDEFGKESGKYVSALKNVRHDIKEELLNAAQGTEYADTMKDLATKFDALDRIKGMLGKNVTTREGRAESFIRNINNMGKTQQRKWLDDFQSIFGGDYLNEAKMATMARQLGEGGEASWLPQHFTGKSLLGIGAGAALHSPMVGLATSSPKVATRVILPATQGIKNITSGVESLLHRVNQLKRKGK